MSLFHKALILSAAALICHSALSQELAGVSYSYFPSSHVTESIINNPEIEVQEFRIFFNLPKRLKNDKTVILNGLDYTGISPSLSNDAGIEPNSENLHVISYKLAINHQLKNNWTATVLMMPTISSSFSNSLEGDDFIFNAAVLFTRKKNDSFSYSIGGLITSSFGTPIPIPTFRLKKKTAKSDFNISLPSHIIYKRFYGDFSAGLQLKVSGSQFNTSYVLPSNPVINESVEQIRYSRITLGPQLSYRFNKFLIATMNSGLVTGRRYELEDNNAAEVDYSLENGAFFQFGLYISPIGN